MVHKQNSKRLNGVQMMIIECGINFQDIHEFLTNNVSVCSRPVRLM